MAGDIDGIVADYNDDAVFITPAGALHGKHGVRQGFTALLTDLPNAKWDVPTQVFEGDVLFIELSVVAAATRPSTGSIRSSSMATASAYRRCATPSRAPRRSHRPGTGAPRRDPVTQPWVD